MTMSDWIVIANASMALIYAASRNKKDIQLLKKIEHPESRLKGVDLNTDGPGRYKTPEAPVGGSYVEEKPPKEIEAEKFAHELVKELEKAHQEKIFSELFIFAPPHFHGLVNKMLSESINKVSKHIQKDYTHIPGQELPDTIRKELIKEDILVGIL